jgi:hypothetical protein
MKRIFVIFILLWSSVAFADQGQVSLMLGGYTDHIKNKTFGYPPEQKNDDNWAIGARYEVIDNLEITASVFRNSLYKTSETVTLDYTFAKTHGVEFSAEEAVANGYGTSTNPDVIYTTYARVCYRFGDANAPALCAKTNVAQSNSNSSFSEINFSIVIPLTNILK